MPTNTLYRYILLIAMLISGGISAQNTPKSLDDCLGIAISNNIRTKNSIINEEIAEEAYLVAAGRFTPTVGASANFSKRFGRSIDPQTNLYTSSSFLEGNIGLSFSLSLFEGFCRVNRLKFYNLNRALTRIYSQITENEVAFDVINAYYSLCFKKKLLLYAVEQRQLSERYLSKIIEQQILGLKSNSDVQEIKARLQADIYQEVKLKSEHEHALLLLKKLLNLPLTENLSLIDESEDVSLPPIAGFQLEDLLSKAERVSPQILASGFQQQMGQKSIAMSQGELLPTVRLNAGTYTGYYDTKFSPKGEASSFGMQLKNNQNTYIGVTVAIPIFNGFTRISDIRKAKLQLNKMENEAKLQTLSLHTEVTQAHRLLTTYIQEHKLALEQLAAYTITLSESEEKWTQGLVSSFELMEKRNQYMAAKVELIRVRIQLNIQLRTLHFYQDGTFITN